MLIGMKLECTFTLEPQLQVVREHAETTIRDLRLSQLYGGKAVAKTQSKLRIEIKK